MRSATPTERPRRARFYPEHFRSSRRLPSCGRSVQSVLGLVCLLLGFGIGAAQAQQIPQIPAFLPMVDAVPPGERSAIDGEWRISSIGKRIRIEEGRAYAVDPWLHLFVLKIEPGMVVIKNIQSQGRGRFSGEDLPLLGKWDAERRSDGRLDVTIAGAFGPVRYQLIPIRLDRPYQEDDESWDDEDGNDYEDWPEDDYEDSDHNDHGDGDDTGYDEDAGYDDEAEDDGWTRTGPDSTPGCGGLGEKPCRNVPATFVAKAKNLGCPGKQSYFSTLKGGSCWTCPSNYKRTARPMNHAKACKKRKSLSGPWKRATYKSRAWGCPDGQFHMGPPAGGRCMTCPAGYKRIAAAGADTGICKVERACDAGLRKAKAPPKNQFIDSLVGSRKAKVCAAPFDVKAAFRRDMVKFNTLKSPGVDFIEAVLGDKPKFRSLKRAIKQQRYGEAFKVMEQFVGFSAFVNKVRRNGFDSLSVGFGSDIQIGVGGNGEVGFAVDLRNERVVGYESLGFTKGLSIGVDSGVTIGLWKGGFESGYTQGFTGSVGGVVSAGMGLWYTYYDPKQARGRGQERLAGLTFTGGVGLGIEYGEYNEVGTKVYAY